MLVRFEPAGVRYRLASVEVSNPGETGRLTGCFPSGLQVFLPWLPKSSTEGMVEKAVALRNQGFRPVPHLAARRLASTMIAQRLLERLRRESGVDTVLVIGGEREAPAGPYASAIELLESGLLERHGIRHVGFGVYPEGHPSISTDLLEEAIAAKLAGARSRGLAPFVLSQFCFDGQRIGHFIRALRQRGEETPFRIGLAGPANALKLLELGVRCGVGDSLRALRGNLSGIGRLLGNYSPDSVIKDIPALEGDVSLHLFALGGVRLAAQWLENSCSTASAASRG